MGLLMLCLSGGAGGWVFLGTVLFISCSVILYKFSQLRVTWETSKREQAKLECLEKQLEIEEAKLQEDKMIQKLFLDELYQRYRKGTPSEISTPQGDIWTSTLSTGNPILAIQCLEGPLKGAFFNFTQKDAEFVLTEQTPSFHICGQVSRDCQHVIFKQTEVKHAPILGKFSFLADQDIWREERSDSVLSSSGEDHEHLTIKEGLEIPAIVTLLVSKVKHTYKNKPE